MGFKIDEEAEAMIEGRMPVDSPKATRKGISAEKVPAGLWVVFAAAVKGRSKIGNELGKALIMWLKENRKGK